MSSEKKLEAEGQRTDRPSCARYRRMLYGTHSLQTASFPPGKRLGTHFASLKESAFPVAPVALNEARPHPVSREDCTSRLSL